MSTPDAAPVEVEGGRPEVAWLDGKPVAMLESVPVGTVIATMVRDHTYMVEQEASTTATDTPVVVVAWPDGTPPTPPAAPSGTTGATTGDES